MGNVVLTVADELLLLADYDEIVKGAKEELNWNGTMTRNNGVEQYWFADNSFVTISGIALSDIKAS